MFQNNKLNELKGKQYTIPDLCFINDKSNLKLMFNDNHKTAISSLFYYNTLLTVKIYPFEFKECHFQTNSKTNSIKINGLVYFKDNIKLDQSIRLVSLKVNTNYLLEVI